MKPGRYLWANPGCYQSLPWPSVVCSSDVQRLIMSHMGWVPRGEVELAIQRAVSAAHPEEITATPSVSVGPSRSGARGTSGRGGGR